MLEIGTIVYLKNGSQKLMIVNRGVLVKKEDKTLLYDYSACLYPMGYAPDHTFYFNEENIDKVIFKGYHDEEEERFIELYNKWLEENHSTYEQGKVAR